MPTVGSGEFQYQPIADWAQTPSECKWPEVAAVAVDRQDRVYVFNRGPQPIAVFDKSGTFLHAWGEGQFQRAHGLMIGPDDCLYCTDDLDHTVKKFTLEGKLLQTLGTSGQPADTGATSIDFRTIKHAGPPFYFPTNVAFSPEGEIYVSDGYGNSRVHKFSPDGRLLFSWGSPGSGPGEFHVPHGIAVDKSGTVFVADRENSRIQLFSPDGVFLSEWKDIARPCQVAFDRVGNLFVAELGYRAGMWPGTVAPSPEAPGGRVSVFNAQGELLARWGGGTNPTAPGDFFAPHDICIDSQGDVYVAEVMMSAGGNKGLVSPDCHSLQKFVLRTPMNRKEVITQASGPPTGELAPGVELRVLATGSLGAKGLTTALATFRPGAELPYHQHTFSEVIVVLEGEALVSVQGRRYRMTPYDAMHLPAGTPHSVCNASPDKRAVLHSSFASDTPSREQVLTTFEIEDREQTSDETGETLVRFETAEIYELAPQALFRDLFGGKFGARGICGGYGIFQPGASLPCHFHEYDESITIVTGKAVCQVAGNEHTLSDCATACVPKGRPHRFINRFEEPMAMIWVYAGDNPERTLVEPGFCEGTRS